jgi:hypothetical protein
MIIPESALRQLFTDGQTYQNCDIQGKFTHPYLGVKNIDCALLSAAEGYVGDIQRQGHYTA